jgi:hypothetical protein
MTTPTAIVGDQSGLANASANCSCAGRGQAPARQETTKLDRKVATASTDDEVRQLFKTRKGKTFRARRDRRSFECWPKLACAQAKLWNTPAGSLTRQGLSSAA